MAAHGIMRVSASVVASRPHRVCALVWRAAFLRGKTRTVYTPIPYPLRLTAGHAPTETHRGSHGATGHFFSNTASTAKRLIDTIEAL